MALDLNVMAEIHKFCLSCDDFTIYTVSVDALRTTTCVDPEGGTGGPDPHPPEKSQKYRYLSTGPDPLKHHKANKPAFNVGPTSARQRNAI